MGISVDSLCNTHTHLREGAVTPFILEQALKGGADVLLPMPNTSAGLKTCDQVLAYIGWLKEMDACKRHPATFIPTLMITEETPVDEIDKCVANGIRDAKVYPRDRTTKSGSTNGVRDYLKLLPAIKRCGEVGMRVHFHPEHPWMEFGERDSEYLFLPIVDMFLRATDAVIVWEHGTDARCIPFWKEMAQTGRFYLTLTAHHLAASEDDVAGDVRARCKPSFKTKYDMTGLRALVAENHPWVMAGLDDAPHDEGAKHVHQGKCACGAYTPYGLLLYAHVFKTLFDTGLGRATFLNFTSHNGRRLYSLEPAKRQFWLLEEAFTIPPSYHLGDWKVEPFWAGERLHFSLSEKAIEGM